MTMTNSGIAKAQADLDRDAAKHGQGGHQVRDDLKKRGSQREWCAKHQGDWELTKEGRTDHYRDIQQHGGALQTPGFQSPRL